MGKLKTGTITGIRHRGRYREAWEDSPAGRVDCCYAECQSAERCVMESCTLYTLYHLLSPDEFLDRAVEIGVCRLVLADETADKRENVREEEVVATSYERVPRERELE